MADYQKIAPWAAGRPSLYSFLKEREPELRKGATRCELPCDKFYKEADEGGAFHLPFREFILRRDVFAAVVEPAVADLPGSVVLAPILLDLLEKTVLQMDARSCIALYQLLVAQNLWKFETLDEFASLLDTGTIINHPLMHDFFLWMLYSTPDETPAKFSLYMLRRTKPAPPKDLVHLFALHDTFSGWACGTIADCYEDTEDLLLDIAKAHVGWGRIHAIRCLSSVVKLQNKQWLLHEGYKTDYTPYLAAVHGDLIGRLRAGNLDLDELIGLATVLAEMRLPFPSDVLGLGDYTDGPEACRLVIAQCERQPLDERLFWPVARLADFMATGCFDDSPDRARVWTRKVREDLAERGRRYLTKPGWPDDFTRRWSNVFEPEKPTVKLLADGDLSRFQEVLRAAIESEEIEIVIDWAVSFLELGESVEERSARRLELEEICMPGICSGGIYGLTDPSLNSVYGQIVLQLLHALANAPEIGWEIIRAGLRSDTRFHRLAAAEALANWPGDRLNPEIVAELHRARRESADGEAIAAIDKLLVRSPPLPEGRLQ